MLKEKIQEEFEKKYERMLAQEKDPEMIAYYLGSKNRYKHILELMPEDAENIKILDIGVSRFTYMLRELYKSSEIWALDFQECELELKEKGINFVYHNLEKDTENIPQEKFDFIIFTEVIEHLWASPIFVLGKLSKMLKKGGKLLLTTPNFLNIGNRLKFTSGKNPLEPIRENLKNPGHVREYCQKELEGYVDKAGLKILKSEFPDYWKSVKLSMDLYKVYQKNSIKSFFYFFYASIKNLIATAFPGLRFIILIVAERES